MEGGYAYDSLNRLTLLREHQPNNLPTGAAWGNWLSNPTPAEAAWAADANDAVTTFAYDDENLGLLASIQRPNGVETTYSYDAPENPYWVTEIEHRDAANAVLGAYTYDYDNLGKRLSIAESNASGVVSNYSYSYDAANRLTKESITGTNSAVRSYSYDRAGNRLTSSYMGQVTRYTYNSSDELTRLTLPNQLYQTYEYDTAGNLIQQYGSLGTANYSYNSRNLLTTVSGGISYQYDHAGRRIQENAGGVTHYLWDEFSQYGDVVLETVPVAGNLVHSAHYTLANGMLLNQTVGTDPNNRSTLYFLSDAQNSTRLMAGNDGAVSSSYAYDAFGNLQGDPLNSDTKYLYTGQQYDYQTELYSLRARYYDPSLGRFMSRDTWAYDYGNPVELNRYVYAAGNPVRYSDPSGYAALAGYGYQVNWGKVATASLSGGAAGFVGSTVFWLASYFTGCGMDREAWLAENPPLQFIAQSTLNGFLNGAKYSIIAQIDPIMAMGFLLGDIWQGFSQIQNPAQGMCVGLAALAGGAAAKSVQNYLTAPRFPIKSNMGDAINVGNGGGNQIVPVNNGAITVGGSSGGLVPIHAGASIGADIDIIPCQNSFSADTEVSTPEGSVPIAEIDIGDTVFAYNEETGITGEYTVTDTMQHEDDAIVTLTVNGEAIETTPWHKFYTDEGWVEAEDLAIGDKLLSLGGVYGEVESILIEDRTQTMYDLTVEEVHTFAVGDGEWVVHNKTWCGYNITSTKWQHSDPDLADLANLIETQFPNRILGVGSDLEDLNGVPIPHPSDSTGSTLIDLDIEGDTFLIEVKGGNGSGLGSQVQVRITNDPLNRTIFGFSRTLSAARNGIVAAGGIGISQRDLPILLDWIRDN